MSTTNDPRLVVMTEELFSLFVELLEKSNGKKYRVDWSEQVGRDEVTGQRMFVPLVYDLVQDDEDV